jgi:hypothetical protein
VLQLIGRLGDVPMSRYRAAVLGDDFMGWGRTERILADLFDRITAVGATGKVSDDALYQRPTVNDETDQAATVADFDVDAFQRQLGQ